jgi:ornithine cyclodeaminase
VIARWHLEALPRVRPIERVRVASRTADGSPEGTPRFVEQMRPHTRCALEAMESAEAAVRGADIVVTATTAQEPVLERAWLAPGTHVNAIGASRPPHREIDTATWAAAVVFVDRRESVESEAADYRRARDEGVIGPEHIRAELGELLVGRARGRTARDEVTLFRSLGLLDVAALVEDMVTAQYLLEQGEKSGVGTRVDF